MLSQKLIATINIHLVKLAPCTELGPIRVNAVSPAVIDTPRYDRMPDDKRKEYLEHYGTKLPVKRLETPEDVAGTVLYLILNAHTTGTLAEVNGRYRVV